MRARPTRAIVDDIVIVLLAGGCVTKSAMMVGSAREVDALVPFAVIADVVTFPFRAVYFLLIGMSH